MEAQIADQAKAHGMPEERVLEEVIVAPHAVKRLIEPAEVADVVAFLLGPGGPVVHRRAGDDGPGLDRALTQAPSTRSRCTLAKRRSGSTRSRSAANASQPG